MIDLAALPIFPCNLAKEPLTAHGFKDAKRGAKAQRVGSTFSTLILLGGSGSTRTTTLCPQHGRMRRNEDFISSSNMPRVSAAPLGRSPRASTYALTADTPFGGLRQGDRLRTRRSVSGR